MTTALALRHLAFEDLGILGPLLERRGHRIAYRDISVDPLDEAELLGADLLVVLGGPIGVYETGAYPFLGEEAALIARRIAAGAPTLGICLGAQLIARAAGACVVATGRKEIGYAPLDLTPEGEASPLKHLDGSPVLHWHGDRFETPAGADRLAATPGFPDQAFALGPNVLGLQFHLEADHTRIEQWLIGHAHELAAAGVDPARIRADARAHGPALASAADRVFASWLDGLRPHTA
ncbi:glutamine amidotransferase [Nocardiopsis composta]|uniref:GMP synthase (Glutamine-hydrolyzing) n=1 Tax=Nocardiopsis composta TaxID=157465 RepID=A0A7W8QJ43_9ACTN|nr:glutamine amidotransferase [Nocardiopsis composta]MBB5431225.1 GMP synthase (glutamine-hydrolyzing) [Nocardiopsis composta]